MTHPREVVEHFMRAYYAGDTETARRYVRDDVSFTGPAASFTSADDYLSTSAHAASMLREINIQRIIVDDGDVCVFSHLETKAFSHPMLVADWYHLEGDRIASIHTIFDTGPFVSGSVEHRQDFAVDPVCHMNVDIRALSPTRAWENTTYHFCSEGCARAFGSNPDRYVAPR
jgi:Cu+-exporting ATPase